jgi:hypothetical protein
VAAKCNIILKALEKLHSIQYNTEYVEDLAIAENYAEYLTCPTLDLHICNPSNCNEDSQVEVINCHFAVGRIKLVPTECTRIKNLDITGLINWVYTYNDGVIEEYTSVETDAYCFTNAEIVTVRQNYPSTTLVIEYGTTGLKFTIDDVHKSPTHTYYWGFSSNYLEAVDGVDKDVLHLVVKEGVNPDLIVYAVLQLIITVTNSQGCVAQKTCYYNAVRGMNCTPYTPCLSPENLVVVSNTTACTHPVDLEVAPNYS